MNKKILSQTPNPKPQTPASGFTLVEMSIVLIVIGLIILTVFPGLMALRTSNQRSLTQSNLQALMQATAAYVQANGCLPCPTPASFTGNGFGRVGTAAANATTAPACGTCVTDPVNHAVAEGIPPFMSLGLPAGTAHDGWGHWITMRIDPLLANPSSPAIVPPTKPVACACAPSTNGTSCTATSCSTIVAGACTGTPVNCSCSQPPVNNICSPLPVSVSQQGLCQPNLSSASGANPLQIFQNAIPNGTNPHQLAAVIFVSHGANGFGSFLAASSFLPGINNGAQIPLPGIYTSCASGSFARCNAQLTAQFVEAPGLIAATNPYDDVLAYADRNTLVSMLGNGGCQTVW